MIITQEELKQRVSLSLRDKIDLSCERIEKWYDHWDGKIYTAFSGGKDSLVLQTLVRSIFPEIPSVFNDTGLEYPEIKEFVKTFENVETTKPKLTYRQVIEKHGFPVISKEQSRFLSEYRTSKSEKLKNIRLNGNRWGMGKISKKWLFMLDAPFKISHKCCDVLKKDPAKRYERITGRKAMIGSTTEESIMRKQTYMRFGCNAYDTNRPISMPLAFWTEQNILTFLLEKNIKLATVYGNITKDEKTGLLKTTGVNRTGCVWCMYGIQNEKDGENKFQKLKISHPVIWNYCINKMGLGDVLDFMEIPYE